MNNNPPGIMSALTCHTAVVQSQNALDVHTIKDPQHANIDDEYVDMKEPLDWNVCSVLVWVYCHQVHDPISNTPL